MLIRRLELENFKSYAQATIHFKPGTNAIIGANGAGKSSILEAIGFALFDSQPPGSKLSGLLHEGAKSGRVLIAMISSFDEREYEVERAFTTTTTSRYRVYDPELGVALVEGNEEVKTWLHQHLKVDAMAQLKDLFENTIGVPQGTFTAPFLETRTAARKSKFDPLLQVEEYQKASESLRDTKRYLDERVAEARVRIADMEGQLRALSGFYDEATRLTGSLAELERCVTRLQGELARGTAVLQALDQAEARAREATMAWQSAQIECRAHETRLTDARGELAEAEEAVAQVEANRAGHEAYLRADEALNALDRRRAQRDNLRQSRAQVENAQGRLEVQLKQLAEAMAEIETSARRLQEMAPLVAQQEALEAALHKAEADMERLKGARREEERVVEELTRARQELDTRRKGLAEAETLERRVTELQGRLDELAGAERRDREARATDEALRERLRKQNDTLADETTARCPVCEGDLTPAHRAELLARNGQLIRELAAEIKQLEAKISGYSQSERHLREELKQAQQSLRHLPSGEDLRRAEETVTRWQSAWEKACAAAAAVQDAPLKVETIREALAALGDPRREAQRHEDAVQQRPAREREQAQAQAKARQIAGELDRLDSELAVYAQLDAELAAARDERARHERAHRVFWGNERIAGQRAARSRRVADLERELVRRQAELTTLEAEHLAAQAAYDARAHLQMRDEVNRLREGLASTNAQLKGQRERLDVVAAEIARLEAMQRDLKAQRAALSELDELAGLVETTRDLLRTAGPHITRQLVRQISSQASALYSDIMDDHGCRLEWSEDYELSLKVRGQTRIYHQFSGGEQMSAALALRLALLRETSAIDVAFFDEPTAHLDAERRDGLAEKIMQVKGFAQLFVISHDDTFERAAQSYIRIVKDETGSHVMEE